MNTMELNGNEDFSNDMYVEQSLPSGGEHKEYNIFGEQQIFPRTGQDYQVEIPVLLKKSDYLSNFKSTSFDIASEKSTELGNERHLWSDVEQKSFVLSLYIFSRNFVQIKRFLESIKMKDILCYYYGSFYKSQEYCQWSERRKIRRKGVVGQKIFTGLRQKEFISRILSSISEEDKNAVLQVCKMFEEEKITFEEYIFSMKNLVGINVLVESVGIGKGKQDLTTMALEPSRSNLIMPPIPSGKKCASLTFNEIVKYLTGNYRLSKARSSDLFWEAVWPRLLAKGWHSEEPKDQLYNVSGRKNDLVFLVPGIPEFSRRNLTNGKHYFDSVTDVLKKVASDPSLIELENEDDDDSSKINLKEEENVKRHCYLQPRGSVCAVLDVMKFTIIDTGLDDGRVRELRSLSFDFSSYKIDSINCPDITDDNISEGSVILSNRKVLSDMKSLDNNDVIQVPCPPRTDSDKNIHSCEDDTEYIAPVAKKRRKIAACDHHHAQTDNVVKSQPLVLAVHHDVAENGAQIQNSIAIDLNQPADCGNAEFNEDHDDETNNKGTSFAEQELTVNTQRRGTRNRPPTTRVLEAVAFGLLSVNTPRRKGSSKTGKYKKEKPSSRHLQRARPETTDLSHVQSDHLAPPGIQENQNGASNGSSNRSELEEFQVLHEENGSRFSSS